MKWWKKKEVKQRQVPEFMTNALTRSHHYVLKSAAFLQRKSNGYSVRKKKILLLFFVLLFVFASIVILIDSLTRKQSAIGITKISPVVLQKENGLTAPRISKGEFKRIQKFKQLIDSLSKTQSGKMIKDSLLRGRPHLMDSVHYLLSLYSEQVK